MSNRKERRAAEAISKKAPKVDNLSGTDESCGNCGLSRSNEVLAQHNAYQSFMKRENQFDPMDENCVVCLKDPNAINKVKWGWCSYWKPKT